VAAQSNGLEPSVVAAVITAAVAVVVAVITQLETWRRDRAVRRYELQRGALMDVQDAALQLRGRLRDYGQELRQAVDELPQGNIVAPTVQPRVNGAAADAEALLEVRLVRVDNPRVVESVASWRAAASEHFISQEDVTADEEKTAWSRLNAEVGSAFKR
jgi:hypothetical protein